MTLFIFETIIEFSAAIRNVYAQLMLVNRGLTSTYILLIWMLLWYPLTYLLPQGTRVLVLQCNAFILPWTCWWKHLESVGLLCVYFFRFLKLYCRYEYTKPCKINCILGLKTTMNSGEWTCLISFATAPLNCSERGGSEKFKMKIYVSSGIRTHTHHASPRQESQLLRPLSHEGLMVISGLMSYRIMGYKLKKNCYVTTRVNLILVTCVFELNVRLNFHHWSHCRF